MVKTRIEIILQRFRDHIDFFEAVPEYDVEMYIHKKMKTTPETSLTVLKAVSSDDSRHRKTSAMTRSMQTVPYYVADKDCVKTGLCNVADPYRSIRKADDSWWSD